MRSIRLIGCFILLIGCDSLLACDFCNYYLGINPNYNQNAIGLRFRTSSYTGNHSHNNIIGNSDGHIHTESSANYEFYGTYALWGRWYPVPKLQLTGNFPISDNYEMENNEKASHITGIGDLMLVALYQVYNTPSDSSSAFNQRLFLGGGIKFPTGVYRETSSDGELEPLLQPGTGSFDFIASLNYLAKIKKAGLNTDITYRINTSNKNGFQFANRLNATVLLFYKIPIKAWTLIPSGGVYYEQALMDLDNNTYLQNTGGKVLFSQFGVDIYYKNFSVNFGYQIPVYENLFGVQGKNQNRLITGISYAFN